MDATDFIRTIYLGDRGCKAIIIDTCNHSIKVQVTKISRIRGEHWNYYSDEDIEDGYIVFENVTKFMFEPQGLIPDDFIYSFDIIGEYCGTYQFAMQIGSVNPINGEQSIVNLLIESRFLYLEDPLRQGFKIIS